MCRWKPAEGVLLQEKTSSPTLSNDAFFLTLLFDANERRDVATANAVGAYLHAFMTDFVLMKFNGKMVELMCKINPNYIAYVTMERSVRTLYIELNKALYGCVQSALLWYKTFSRALKESGFTVNPYDPCMANATIKESQCTIAWFVNNNKISHKDPEVVMDVI